MTNENIVKTLFPDARVESHKTGFPSRRYYLLRNGREYMYMAEGETKSKAWKNALPVALNRAKSAMDELVEIKSSNTK